MRHPPRSSRRHRPPPTGSAAPWRRDPCRLRRPSLEAVEGCQRDLTSLRVQPRPRAHFPLRQAAMQDPVRAARPLSGVVSDRALPTARAGPDLAALFAAVDVDIAFAGLQVGKLRVGQRRRAGDRAVAAPSGTDTRHSRRARRRNGCGHGSRTGQAGDPPVCRLLVAVSTLTCALPLPGLCTGGTSALLARVAL